MSSIPQTHNRLLLILRTLGCLLFIVFTLYLSLPQLEFPQPPQDALQSNEPADTETILRRAYFTNYTREEVLKHYQRQLRKSYFGVNMPQYRLNYPPEESHTIIRDQTRSTFLEEIVHPMRTSLYINGFEPKDEKDSIFIENKNWRQKIIVRYIPSNVYYRLIFGVFTVIVALFMAGELIIAYGDLFNFRRKK